MKNPELFVETVDHACRVMRKLKQTGERVMLYQRMMDEVFEVITRSETRIAPQVWGAVFQLLHSGPRVDSGATIDMVYQQHKKGNTPLYRQVVREAAGRL